MAVKAKASHSARVQHQRPQLHVPHHIVCSKKDRKQRGKEKVRSKPELASDAPACVSDRERERMRGGAGGAEQRYSLPRSWQRVYDRRIGIE